MKGICKPAHLVQVMYAVKGVNGGARGSPRRESLGAFFLHENDEISDKESVC